MNIKRSFNNQSPLNIEKMNLLIANKVIPFNVIQITFYQYTSTGKARHNDGLL